MSNMATVSKCAPIDGSVRSSVSSSSVLTLGYRPAIAAFLNPILCGTAGSLGWVLVGQPLDTVKVRLQTGSSAYPTAIRDLFREGGVKAFYRGGMMEFNLAMCAGCMKMPFYTHFREKILPNSWGDSCIARARRASWSNSDIGKIAVLGFVSGLFFSLVFTPLEALKCRLQVTPEGASSVQRLRAAYQMGSVFNGTSATVLRCAPGNAIYFATWEVSKVRAEQAGLPTFMVRLFGGGMAGFAFWTLVHPVDCVKTRMQTSPSWSPSSTSFTEAASELYAASGVRGFTKGLLSSSIRSFPASAAFLASYDTVHSYLC